MKRNIRIRSARIEDAEAIFNFIEELEDVHFDYEFFKTYYAENLLHKDYIYLVAETEENIVAGYISCHGQVLLHHLAKVFEIQELFVKKEYRGQKIGGLLLEKLEEILRTGKNHLLEVTANIIRTQTHLFYQNNGFVRTHYKFIKEL